MDGSAFAGVFVPEAFDDFRPVREFLNLVDHEHDSRGGALGGQSLTRTFPGRGNPPGQLQVRLVRRHVDMRQGQLLEDLKDERRLANLAGPHDDLHAVPRFGQASQQAGMIRTSKRLGHALIINVLASVC